MKKLRFVLLGLLALLIACLVLGLVGYVLYRTQRERALTNRPLVLIHAPLNRDQVTLGMSVLAHATARADSGVSRVELWADGAFVTAREYPGEKPATILPLVADWQPQTLGPHVLLVRAFSADGVKGQSTVAIEVVAPEAAPEAEAGEEVPVEVRLVRKEDETLEGIAEEEGVDLEELEDLNPGLGGDLQPGDVVAVPGDETPSGGEPPEGAGVPPEDEAGPPPEGEEPPAPHAPAPESTLSVMELLWGGVFALPEPEEEAVGLRVEALALETGGAYESLHCYIGVGEDAPRWYPDMDDDQTTDESFASLGGGSWDVAAHLSEGTALIVPWPGSEPLPIDVTCVGVVGGATDAVELGRVLITARPEAWDGLTRRAVASSDEGSFTLDYRITQVESEPRGHPIFLDPSMTPPTNLHMGFWTLHWDYEPRADEEPIHGFRVYLNDTLQWVEPPDARYSTLPYEWLSPPCGETYNFTVTVFRYGYPDGPESRPSNVVPVAGGEPGSDGCNRTLIVQLDTLSTEYLEHDMGAIYGSFYVNDQVIRIDGHCDGPGLCGEVGLYADYEYDIHGLTSYLAFGASPRFLVDVPPDEQLVIGYEINAEGEGLACAGETWYEGGELDRVHEGSILSERPSGHSSRCRVSFTVNPAFGSAVAGIDGEPPLPMLMVENLTVKEETGQLQIHVRNTGAGTWPAKDLDVAVTWPNGSGIGAYTWPGLILRPGERAILEHPDLVPGPHPPLGACVTLDPGNEVPEEDDRQVCDDITGDCMYIWRRGRYCRPLPDLTITDVQYDSDGERLLVTVQNVGEGSVEHRDLGLQINLADGRYFAAPHEWWADVSIEPRQEIVMEWPHIGPEQRALMLGGYTAVIDPNNDIAEESGTNNEYTVRASTRLWLSWTWINVPYDFRDTVEYSFDAYAVSGGVRRPVADWHIGQDIDWGSCFRPYHCVRHYDNEEYDSYWFDIAGDEGLVVEIVVSHPGTLHQSYTISDYYAPEDGWGAGPVGPRRSCGYLGGGGEPHSYTWVFDYHEGETWDTTFHICREDAE
jgi:LysM repeat protein